MTDELDLDQLLEVLDRHGVVFLVAGSVAAAAHGAPDVRPGDLDIVPEASTGNLERLRVALGELGAVPSLEHGEWRRDDLGEYEWVADGVPRVARPLDTADVSTFDHSFATPFGRLDVVPRVAGAYSDLAPRSSLLEVNGRTVPVVGAVDLLATLTRPRRTKDVARVRHLREVARRGASH